MKRPLIRTKSGRYTWLQLLALLISSVAFMLGSMPTAVVMLVIATAFGVLAMMGRARQAQQLGQRKPEARQE